MTEQITNIYELDMKINGWISLPRQLVEEVGNEIFIAPGNKNTLLLFSATDFAKIETELKKKAKSDKKKAKSDKKEDRLFARFFIGSSCDYTINKSGKFRLIIQQQQLIELSSGPIILFKKKGRMYLISRKNWHQINMQLT